MKRLGIGLGDEVITAANTFIATAGAIVATGARPVFVDSEEGFVIDVTQIEAAITKRTRAIVPVHYTGNVADMPTIMKIADAHELPVVEDCAQAIGAKLDDKPVGSWGKAGAFSVHPLKNINVWGDGGLILTNDESFAEDLRLYRNHGLTDRDHVKIFGINSRLDSIQALIGTRLMHQAPSITDRRVELASLFDDALGDIDGIFIPKRRQGVRHVFHLYILRVERRDDLLQHLINQGIEAKVHYPIPIHLQDAATSLGYTAGDFPVTENDAECVITLPAHQHITDSEANRIIEEVRGFYSS